MTRPRSPGALALAAFALALFQLGCPNSGPTQAQRNARLAKARKAMEESDQAEETEQRERTAALGHPWPPLRGKEHPDLTLFDLAGKEVKLSSFKGKVILLHFVATTSPGSIAQAGGFKGESYQGVSPQAGVWRLDKELKEANVPVDSPDLIWLQVMVYGPRQGVPTLSDAKAWAKHFKLAERPRTRVLYTDKRYQVPATYALVPGYFVIDREFKFVYDRANMISADGYTEVANGLKWLLRKRHPAPPAYSPSISPQRVRLEALGALLKEGKHEQLDAELKKIVAKGYRKDEPGRTHLDEIKGIYSGEGINESHFASWVAASPESFVAAYLKGIAHVKWGWKARGHGWASTVTEEGWKVFRRELGKAGTAFTLANQRSSTQAYGYTGLLIVARATSAPDTVREAYFNAARLADPDYLAAYEMNLEAIYPKWGGSAEAALEFVYGVVEARPDYVPFRLLIPSLHYEFSRTVVDDAKSYLTQEQVASDCRKAIARLQEVFPKSLEVAHLDLRIALRQGAKFHHIHTLLAELGDPWTMGQYGYWLKRGQRGMTMDLPRARDLLIAAGRAGDSLGCAEVAHMLVWHKDFHHNFARAIPWFEEGAKGGNTWCALQLGYAYNCGRGVKLDRSKAATWFRRADSDEGRGELAKILRKNPELRQPGD
ncbi:MAG: DUF4034 domain-containing protein [Planctomycetes bacterium]|nr:DUF4034 domain-containing protein [Planctomycetota bacterium]